MPQHDDGPPWPPDPLTRSCSRSTPVLATGCRPFVPSPQARTLCGSARTGRLGRDRREQDEDQDHGEPDQETGSERCGDEGRGVALHVSV